MNVRKIILMFLFAFFHSISNAQNCTDSLAIDISLQKEYIIGEIISFNYKNNSKSDLYVGVALERASNDGEWLCYLNDVFREYVFSKSGNKDTVNIVPKTEGWPKESFWAIKDSRTDNWTVDNCLYGEEQEVTFRLKFTISVIPYGFKPVEKDVILPTTVKYSQSFNVKRTCNSKKYVEGNKNIKFIVW